MGSRTSRGPEGRRPGELQAGKRFAAMGGGAVPAAEENRKLLRQ
jgi:hypothetical protein